MSTLGIVQIKVIIPDFKIIVKIQNLNEMLFFLTFIAHKTIKTFNVIINVNKRLTTETN